MSVKSRNRNYVDRSASQDISADSAPVLSDLQARTVELKPTAPRAYDLLAKQPLSLAGLSFLERSLVVVAAVADESGNEHVVSRVGDAVWDLRSWDWPPNVHAYAKFIEWPDDVPMSLLMDAQNAFYAWLKRGKPGGNPVGGTTFCETVRRCMTTLRFLAARGRSSFSQLRATDIADLHSYLKNCPFEDLSGVPSSKVSRSPGTVRQYMEVVNLVLVFSADVQHPLQIDPWEGRNLSGFVGASRPSGIGKTSVMPRRIVEALFKHCESVIERAPTFLDFWEAGRIEDAAALCGFVQGTNYLEAWTIAINSLLEIRTAILFMLEISTGMRNSEAIGVKSSSWRPEVDKKSGVTFHWITTVEHKTGKGRCDFLAPPELFPVLDLLQRWAAPYQTSLRQEIAQLEMLLDSTDGDQLTDTLTRVDALQLLANGREHINSLFLTVDLGNRVSLKNPVLSYSTCNDAFARLATRANVDWSPQNHECRRTYAWTVANSRIGRYALIFLKWQLKHSTMSMTQLYASNPHQDQDLYDEIYGAIVDAQAEVLSECFDEDEGVAGGFGGSLRELRDRELRGIAVRDKDALIIHTAATETLRNNGHAYCMAEQRGCGGNGLFDAGWCVDCSESLIKSKEHFNFWWNWLILSRDLFDVKDCGQAGQERAAKDIAYAEKVFADFGHPIPPADATYISLDDEDVAA